VTELLKKVDVQRLTTNLSP